MRAKTRLSRILRLSAIPGIGVLVAVIASQAANAQTIGDVFYIEMENHNLTQPSSVTAPQPLLGNSAAPFLNSLMTPGNANAAMTSWASNYHNAAVGDHPSLPNYLWQEAGTNFGVNNDNQPYGVGGEVQSGPHLSGLLQNAGVPWKAYLEDTDLATSGGSVTSTVLPQSQWTVQTANLSGTSASYMNPYNGSHQYNFATKHDGQLYFPDTNGGTLSAPDTSTSNPEVPHYAPLQQLATDLTNNTVARYNLITPDQYNDMHSSLNTDFTYNGTTYTHNTDQESIALGDNFLSTIVPQIEASQAFKNNGAIVIWYDETEGGDTSDFTIPEIVISPLAVGNAFNDTANLTHSSDLRTLENLFGVSAPGGGYLNDANTPSTSDLSGMFVAGAVPTALPVSAPEPGTLPLVLSAAGALALVGIRRRRAA